MQHSEEVSTRRPTYRTGLNQGFNHIAGATGSGSPGSGPFTTIRRYEELKGPGGPGVLGEEQKRAKFIFDPCCGVLAPGTLKIGSGVQFCVFWWSESSGG